MEIDQQITGCLSFRRRKNKKATLCLNKGNGLRGVLPWRCQCLMSLTGPATRICIQVLQMRSDQPSLQYSILNLNLTCVPENEMTLVRPTAVEPFCQPKDGNKKKEIYLISIQLLSFLNPLFHSTPPLLHTFLTPIHQMATIIRKHILVSKIPPPRPLIAPSVSTF